jgi:hypothetical protein
MDTNNIKCPQCGASIALTEALTGQIEQSVKAKYEGFLSDAKKDYEKRSKDVAQSLQAIESQKVALDQEKREYCERVEAGVTVRLQTERDTLTRTIRNQLSQEQAATTVSLMEDIKAKDAALATMRQAELDLRRKSREIEDKAAAASLEAQRALDTERSAIKAAAVLQADEAAALKLREKDSILAQMTEQIEALKRKAETGSQEAQGEAQEDLLLLTLQQTFPFDLFEEVAKGVRGGDIVQTVRTHTGKNAGRILWESKNTKAFSKDWITKVKADQMRSNAAISVIMSVTLPDRLVERGERFGLYEGVWITDFRSMPALTTALRTVILEADKQRVVSENQDSLKDLLYEYLTGTEAQQRVASVSEAVKRMEDDLTAERRAMEKIWASRAKQIFTLSVGFGNFFGGIEGIVSRAALTAGTGAKELEAIAG